MKITILGGTGLIGGRVADRLRRLGHEVVAAARSTGVDTQTGEGLATAMAGADVVLDTSSPGSIASAEAARFFVASAANVAAVEPVAGVKRHVLLSTIGAGTVAGGLFAAKADQERIVGSAPVRFTIVRSAPFFETLYDLAGAGAEGSDVRLPPIVVQPIAADDVADALVAVLLDESSGPLIEIGGPETHRLTHLAEAILAANEDPRPVRSDPAVPFLGACMGGAMLVAFENARLGAVDFEDWLRNYYFRHALRSSVNTPHLRIRSSKRGSGGKMDFIDPAAVPSGTGCAECLAEGGWWFHLRRCAACGHVGCCDSSPSQHAAAHFHATGHKLIQSFEPGEDWFWDYRTEELVEGPELAPPTSRPESQPAPGPSGTVPDDWTRLLHRMAGRASADRQPPQPREIPHDNSAT